MGRPLSEDLRQRLITLVQSGLPARSAGLQLCIAPSTATRLVRQWRERGSYKARPCGGARHFKLAGARPVLEALLEKHNDWTEERIAAWLAAEHGIQVHRSSIGRFLKKMGYSFKKNPAGGRARSS